MAQPGLGLLLPGQGRGGMHCRNRQAQPRPGVGVGRTACEKCWEVPGGGGSRRAALPGSQAALRRKKGGREEGGGEGCAGELVTVCSEECNCPCDRGRAARAGRGLLPPTSLGAGLGRRGALQGRGKLLWSGSRWTPPGTGHPISPSPLFLFLSPPLPLFLGSGQWVLLGTVLPRVCVGSFPGVCVECSAATPGLNGP